MRRGLSTQVRRKADSRRVRLSCCFPPGGTEAARPYDRLVHGVVFASFGDYLVGRLGPDAARRLLEEEPTYLISEAYDDERLFDLIGRAAEEADVAPDAMVREFGVFAAEVTFARLYPAFFALAGSPRAFMLTVEERIHELVRATIPNARPPALRVLPLGDDGVQIEYSSPRRLCVLLRGLVDGTARHYGERADAVERACMRDGAPACLFDVRFSAANGV